MIAIANGQHGARALRVAACVSLLVASACDRASTSGAPAPPIASGASAHETEPAVPTSTSTTHVPRDALFVVLSRQALSLGKDGATLAVPDVDAGGWSKGFDGKYKQSSRNDFYLLPLGAVLRAAYPGEASVPSVAIVADASIAYRMLTETIYTLGQERVRTVDLIVRSAAGKAAIPITLPGRFDLASPISDEARRAMQQALDSDGGEPSAHQASPPAPARSASAQATSPVPLDLNVIVTTPGFVVSAARRRMGPGCHETGVGVAVPRHGETHDFEALTACATTLKSSEPRFATDTRVTLSAEAGVDVQTLVSTLDALRGADGQLFPEVMLGVPK